MKRFARASAPSNIALIKYWGKRDTQRNLPLTSSFSVSLSQMRSHALVEEFDGPEDEWKIYGDPSKAQRVLQLARAATGDPRRLSIQIENTFPSGAGLASSASSMAALSLALRRFFGEDKLPLKQVATWSRRGSGSSVRSLYPGFVHWDAGVDPEGNDCIARTCFPASHLPLALVVCVVDARPKPIGSTAAMERCRDTSPNYKAFHTQNPDDLAAMLKAVQERNFARVGELSEANCLAMHAIMHQASPPIDYFQPGTHDAIRLVRTLREEGTPCFFTIDAGPNVKIFCPPAYQAHVHARATQLRNVKSTLLDTIAEEVEPASQMSPIPLQGPTI